MQTALIRKYSNRAIVLGSIAALGLSLSAGSAFAQEEEQTVEEIVVTGSRIARDPNLTGALPIQSLDSEQIQMSGEFSITDIINDIPALLSSTSSESSIDAGDDFDDGVNVLDLRGLGEERTLVLVNGRRHVGGLQGSGAVDVGTIPIRLVDRIEVLTGGASAIYGADAVTGVVNFIMKDNYEGFGVDVNYGISGDGDGQQMAITATWGTNFANDRGNFVISVDYRDDQGLSMADRPGALFGTGGDWDNPALAFQIGEISGTTPLFEQYFNFTNTGLINYGLAIPTATDFVADYNLAFPATPITEASLNTAELALISRAATAPSSAVLPEVTFPFTSNYGYVSPGIVSQPSQPFGTFGFDTNTPIDLDGNGVPDCQDSFTGWFSGEVPGFPIGGCWRVDANGNYAPIQDGLISDGFSGFGGDSYDVYRQDYLDFLLPDEKLSINLMAHYDVSDSSTLFGEFKYVDQKVETHIGNETFWDLIPGYADNPFVPAFFAPVLASAGGVSITLDPHMFDPQRKTERETIRTVVGIEGELGNEWGYELSANYGRYEQEINRSNIIVIDRWFAALDAVTDPATGSPACRSSVDPTAPGLNTPFQIPLYEEGYFTFTPGDGQCAPLNIWSGRAGVTQAARDFVLTSTFDNLVIDQFVLSAILTGDSADWFELPAGAISFAVGAEYRDESSKATFDPAQRGVIPAGAPFPAGTQISDHSTLNESLTFRPNFAVRNETGSYDVMDVFLEASIPLLVDRPGARELTLDLAARFSDYSTIGQTTTWKTNIIWAPIDSLAFRGTYSEAVRAPNITELFGPQIGNNFRPRDPCDANIITGIGTGDPGLAADIEANCVAALQAIGFDPFDPVTGNYAFFDPLTASFGGIQGGNPNLTEETAETFTAGFVYQPEFLPGLSVTVDYWDILIDDAIEEPSAQSIVDGCYHGAALNPIFCDLFRRNTNAASAQFGGFIFIQQATINFAKLETSGIDFAVNYKFEIGAHGFDATVQGSSVDELNRFQNPSDLTEINPELGEINRPELAGNVFLTWSYGDWQVGWQSQFMDTQLVGPAGSVEIETAQALFGRAVFMDDFWQHDINARYLWNDNVMIYGGIKNITDEQPFISENAFPASPRGTFFFVGVDWQM